VCVCVCVCVCVYVYIYIYIYICMYIAQSREALSRLSSIHTRHGQICYHNTDYVHINGQDRTITVILAKHCIQLPDDGSLVVRNMLE